MTNLVHKRLQITAQEAAKQKPEERVKNFEETFLGFDRGTAMIEAARCIQCPSAPCMEACPVHNDIPGALALLEVGDIVGSANKFRETSNLPEMCGRLCPQEKLCEGACVVGFAIRPDGFGNEPPVAIGKLESYCTDYQRTNFGYPEPLIANPTGKRVAIVGSGPAGLAVAEELTKRGHNCVVFEGWPEPGGVLVYGIPNFKMKKQIVDEYIAYLEKLGVEFRCNTWIGKEFTIDDLLDGDFHSVFLGTGASLGNSLEIEGENLEGVYAATDFLVRGNLEADQLPDEYREALVVGKDCVVIGGGDTSMDCVRTAIRLGAENVTCVYRRTEKEMLGRMEERKNAREEGVQFLYLTVPLRFIGNDEGHVTGVECQRMELGEPDDSGRRRPVPVPGSEFVIPADSVAIAIGYNPDPLVIETTTGISADRKAVIKVDRRSMSTTRPGVFAGGDNVNGADLVVTALADGRAAAQAIDEYLEKLDNRRR